MSAPLRVAMLARVVWPLHGYGGIERHVYHLTTHLAKLGVQITLYVQDAPDIQQLDTLATQMRIHTVRYDYTSPLLRPNSILGRQLNYPRYSMELGRMALGAARRGEYDIVHSQGLCAFGYAWLRRHDAAVRQIPFFANPHGLEEYRTPDWRKWLAYVPFRTLYSAGHRMADYVIATDACTAPDLPHYLGVTADQTVVIPSAIDTAENLAPVVASRIHALRQTVGRDASLLMLSVSRLEHNKGYHVYADVLAQAHQAGWLPADWHWVLVGDGKERHALATQVANLGIGAHVTFAGRMSDSDLQNMYAASDFFVHPTLYEGSSLVTLEAMIHRRPVLASAAGGIPDKVFTGVNGILVPPGDVTALRDGLKAMLAARAEWPAWGAAGAQIVRTQFDWPVVAQRTLAAYQHALQTR